MANRRLWGWVSVSAGVAILVALALFIDLRAVGATLATAPPRSLALAIGLVTVAYAARFAKWHLFVRALRLGIGPARSLQVFLGGLMMAVTPAKVGEVWKAALLRGDGVPVARSLPAVALERLVDLLAIALLAAAGAAALSGRAWALGAVVVAGLAAVLALRHERLWRATLSWLSRRRRLAGPARFLSAVYDGAATLLRWPVLGPALGLGLVAWALEGLALAVLLDGLGARLPAAGAVTAFGLGTLAGVLSLLPGGLGTAEAGMAGALVSQGVALEIAVAGTVLARLATLGYGVVLGIAASVVWPVPSTPQDGGVMDAQRPRDALEHPLHGAQDGQEPAGREIRDEG